MKPTNTAIAPSSSEGADAGSGAAYPLPRKMAPGRLRLHWSDLEDEVFVNAHKELGANWNEIAKRLPGRNYHSVYYHWKYSLNRNTNSHLKVYRLELEKLARAARAEEEAPESSGAVRRQRGEPSRPAGHGEEIEKTEIEGKKEDDPSLGSNKRRKEG